MSREKFSDDGKNFVYQNVPAWFLTLPHKNVRLNLSAENEHDDESLSNFVG